MHFLDFTFVVQVFVYIIHILVTTLFNCDTSTANIMLAVDIVPLIFKYSQAFSQHGKICKAADNVLGQIGIIAVVFVKYFTVIFLFLNQAKWVTVFWMSTNNIWSFSFSKDASAAFITGQINVEAN